MASKSNIKTIKQALDPAFLKQPPDTAKFKLFKEQFAGLLGNINKKETEEFHKNLITDFLKTVYYKDKYFINTKGRKDSVIHNNNLPDSSVGVLY